MELADRVALVTGGGTGLGRAISLGLAHHSCHIAVNYAHSQSEAKGAVDEIRALGCRSMAVRADVSRRADVEGMVAEVEGVLGPIDLLVNNAGVTRYIPFPQIEAVTDEDWERILAVNLKGAFLCAQAVALRMRARGQGKILNVASDSAFSADGSSIPYVVSKAAVVSLTKCLARALGPAVQVNAIAPGWMATRWATNYLPEDTQRRIFHPQPNELPPADLEDIAAVAVHLLGNDSVSGQVLMVNRGDLLW